MKSNVSVVWVCGRCNILISGKIIKEITDSIASGTHCIKAAIIADRLSRNWCVLCHT